ncbi:MAG: hypothetical protein AB9844_12000 [Clostridiaceae bacterium]
MITIEEKALEAAKEKNGVFVVKTLSTSGGEFDMDLKDIVVELRGEFEGPEKFFSVFEYEGIKIYVEKYLRYHDEVKIYQKYKLPFIGRIFKVDGIYVKYV